MPPVRTARASKKAPPEGFDDIEDTLLEFAAAMKDAENASHDGKKKYEMTWPIFQITHQRSRYIYDMYYEKEAISKQLYDWLLKNGYADAMLIAKWKKQGYEKLCCTRCIQTKETNFRSTCICRVPKETLKEGQETGNKIDLTACAMRKSKAGSDSTSRNSATRRGDGRGKLRQDFRQSTLIPLGIAVRRSGRFEADHGTWDEPRQMTQTLTPEVKD
ncbi:cell cycle control protein cwf14 [Paraphaeosphaeria sporulosa]